MKFAAHLAQDISIVLFALYGISCFVSRRTAAEFERYGLPHLRVLTGVLQVAGSLGLIVGHFYPPLLVLAAGGLAAMMFIAMLTRFKIRDPLYLAIPSFSLCILNSLIVVAALRG